MLTEPTHLSKLPADAKIWTAEKCQNEDGECFRVIVFNIDEEGARSVAEIGEAETVPFAVESLLHGMSEHSAWVPVEHTVPGPYYLQPDAISLAEALEAAAVRMIPAFREDPHEPEYATVTKASHPTLFETFEIISHDCNMDGGVYGDAKVFGEAWVFGEARVSGKTEQTPIHISGLVWPTTLLDNQMQIGCELHTFAEWDAFSDERIAMMAGCTSRRFWKAHKELLLGIAKASGRYKV